MAMIVVVMFVGDHPRLFRRYRHEIIVLDRAFPRETASVAHWSSCSGRGCTRCRAAAGPGQRPHHVEARYQALTAPGPPSGTPADEENLLSPQLVSR